MCGIVAEYGTTDFAGLEEMLDQLEHRGPDDCGSVGVGRAWLGHRRLSIVDVTGGRQPLVNDGEDVWLVGNGEVYNHTDVRTRMLRAGHTFVTESDNEVALHLLEEDGPLGLAELNGMYAFVMAADDGRFIAARDPVGIKPLYWAQRGERTRFASEMVAFDEEWQALVEPFPPGCAWTPQDGLIRFARAVPDGLEWMPGPTAPGAAAPADVLRGTRDVLIGAVERQLMGDV
ncbi:MAG TPA: hypothetical protein VGV90_16910, partial [Solirubrobacteraceae bacterium]|nr:hypothetical protein [Solirubrobacteraceae bacterium]